MAFSLRFSCILNHYNCLSVHFVAILKLSPDSPDAKIFKDPNGDFSKTATPASASPAAASTSGSTGSPPGLADGSSSKVGPGSSTGRLQSFMGVGVVVLAVSVAVILM